MLETNQTIEGQVLEGERALFAGKNLTVRNCTFQNGESPLKMSDGIEVKDSVFAYKYPLWYAKNIKVENTKWETMGRAGVWYTEHMSVNDCLIDAPKNFRRCNDITLTDIEFTDAAETLWYNKNVTLKNVKAKGDYFAMGCENVKADGLLLDGNYGFDGVKNLEIRNSKLYTKDAFWNCENVTIYDSYVEGEYFAWNSNNVTLVNCEISSLQGFCYIDNLKLVNCELKQTNLSFEYCTNINAEVNEIKSVLNPVSGRIKAKHIGRLTFQPELVGDQRAEIICDAIDCVTDAPDFAESNL